MESRGRCGPGGEFQTHEAARARGLRQTQERIEKARGKLAEMEAEKASAPNASERGRGAKRGKGVAHGYAGEARRRKDGEVRASYNEKIAEKTDQGYDKEIKETERRNDSGLERQM